MMVVEGKRERRQQAKTLITPEDTRIIPGCQGGSQQAQDSVKVIESRHSGMLLAGIQFNFWIPARNMLV
jgi:hypothetical protein